MQVEEVRISGIKRVGVGTVGSQHQGAVGTDEGTSSNWPGRHTVSTLYIIAQHIAGQRQLVLGGDNSIGIARCARQIIDDVDVDTACGAAAVGIGGGYGETFAEAVGTVGRRVILIVEQGVAVSHHAGGRVVAGDGQGVAQCSGRRLREAAGHPAADYTNAADGQGLHAVQRRHGKASTLGQGRIAWVAAIAEVALVDGQFTTVDVQAVEGHRVVEVADVEYQVGGAGVSVGVLQGVGECLDAVAATVQVEEVRISGIKRVGVGTVGSQHQGAVGTDEGTSSNWPGRNTVSTLYIIAQHIAGQRQLVLGGDDSVGIAGCARQIIDDVDVDTACGAAAVGIGGGYGETFAEAVGTVGIRVRLVVEQGIAVSHHAGCRVVAGDGQGVAQRRGRRLREAAGHSATDHVDAADGQGLHAVQRRHGKASTLGQGRIAWAAAIAEIALVDGQFTTVDVQAVEGHRVV